MPNYTVPINVINLNGNGYHLLVEISVFKKKHFAVLDTGASKSVFDLQFVKEKTLVDSPDQPIQANTLFSTTETLQANIPLLKIGRLKIENFEVLAIDLSSVIETYSQLGHPPIIGIIGGDLLVDHDAVINYAKRTLKLTIPVGT